MIKRLLLLFFVLTVALPAHAEIYINPTWDNLLKTLVRFGALDLSDDKILDEYAIVTDCDLYHAFSGNDFKWNKVRDSMRESVEINRLKFPSSYMYEGKLLLDHYDFKEQMFRFSDSNPLQKVNAFFLFRASGITCGNNRITYLPKAYRAVLDEPVSLPGLPLTQHSADALLRRMAANDNKDRAIYVRFNLHVNYIGKVSREPNAPLDSTLIQTGAAHDAPVTMNAQVDSIDFYEDERMAKLLYSYQP